MCIYLVPAADTSPHVTLHWDQADHVLHLPATAADTRVVTRDTRRTCRPRLVPGHYLHLRLGVAHGDVATGVRVAHEQPLLLAPLA